MWIEICSESEEDWDETFHLLAESFQKSAPFLIEGRSEEDMIRFNYEYFRYLYETHMSNGRGGLICAKERNKDGSISIVYASVFVHRMESSPGNRSAMDAIDVKFADQHIEEDGWLKREILDTMDLASQELGASLLYGAFTACRVDRMRSGLGRKLSNKIIDIYHDDGLRRGYFDKNKPCIFCVIVDDAEALKFQMVEKNIQIAHVHMNGVPKCGLEDPSSQDAYNCLYVFAKALSGNLDVEKILTPYFENVV